MDKEEKLDQLVKQFHDVLDRGGVEGWGSYDGDTDGWLDDTTRHVVQALQEAGWIPREVT